MVLSTQSRLLVVLCGSLLVLAGALAVGSFAGWFQKPRIHEPVPARLRQVITHAQQFIPTKLNYSHRMLHVKYSIIYYSINSYLYLYLRNMRD